MRRVTASGLPLLARCPGQSVLEHYPSTSSQAEEGTRQHDLLVPALVSGRLPDTSRGRALAHVRIPRGAVAELATALDPGGCSARTLSPPHPRDYSECTEGEIPGTGDWSVAGERGELKTGAVMVEPPQRNRQMWHAALTTFWMSGERPLLRLIHAFPPDKQGRSKAIEWHHKPTVGEVLQWHGEIERTVARVHAGREAKERGERIPLVLGDHCGLCDAVLQCSAIGEAVGHGNAASRALTARARRIAAQHEERLANALLMGEEHTEDGRTLVPITKYRRQIDTEAALSRLPGLGIFATTKVTAGDLDRYALSREDLGRTIKDRKKALEQLLEDASGLTWTTTTRHEEQFK